MTRLRALLSLRFLRGLAIPAVAVAIAMIVALPPAAKQTATETAIGTVSVRGAYHVHSIRSDGSATPDQIAAAAARAGLQFVILTDHGDGTRPPDQPHYQDGVLVIDAVELGTNIGHYVALDMPPSPYPLAGDARDVVEDVRRLGGFGIAAHPGSLGANLSWSDWTLDVDGLEWLNADSEWRDERWTALARGFLTYALRGPETLAALLDRPADVLTKWDAAAARRPVVGLAGADAHARLGLRQRTDPDTSTLYLPLPSYRMLFRTFSNRVELDRPLTREAGAAAAAILQSIRSGRVFTVIDGLATPGGFEFTGSSGGRSATMGGDLPLGSAATLHAHISAPPGTTMRLLKDGAAIASTTSASLDADVAGKPGVYRVEAIIDGEPAVPWLVANPIYVGVARAPAGPVHVPPPARRVPAGVSTAQSEAGQGDISTIGPPESGDRPGFLGEPTISWRFALRGGSPSGQFAAIAIPVRGGLADFDRIQFQAKSERPVRLWVQMRAPGGGLERWGATFYAGPEWGPVTVRFDDCLPIGGTSSARPPLDRIDTLLIVADTVNTLPGTRGVVSIRDVAFAHQ